MARRILDLNLWQAIGFNYCTFKDNDFELCYYPDTCYLAATTRDKGYGMPEMVDTNDLSTFVNELDKLGFNIPQELSWYL